MVDYIDNDVAYLIGMIIGRGTIVDDGSRFLLNIEFPFVKPELEGYNQFSSFLTNITYSMLPRLKSLLGTSVDLSPTKNEIICRIEFPSQHLVVRDLKLILGDNLHYASYKVPTVIQETSDLELVREFIRGFADVAGNIRRSNNDQRGMHRVYLDVLNANWELPVQLCYLLQHKLDIPVSNILWGHPNLRDPNVSQPSGSPFREHQIRIYAHEFFKAGFYIEHKQEILKTLAEENLATLKNHPINFCKGYGRDSSKALHPLEKDKHLPKGMRGKHFDTYWQICAQCGCKEARIAVRQKKRQQKLFS